MLAAGEVQAVSEADAKLAAWATDDASRAVLDAWRARRDALIESPDDDHEAVLALVLDAESRADGTFPSLFQGLWNFLDHPLDTLAGKLDPRTPPSNYSPSPTSPAPALGSAAAMTPDRAAGLLGSTARPWLLAGLAVVALVVAAYVANAATRALRAVKGGA